MAGQQLTVLPLPPNTNRPKKRRFKTRYKNYGIEPSVSSGAFVMPHDPPKDPFIAAFNKVLLKLYNKTVRLRKLLDDVDVDTTVMSPVMKRNATIVLKNQISGLRRQGYKIRCFIIKLGERPVNEPSDWTRR